MVRGNEPAEREEMLLKIINDYPHLNNPKDRLKFRRLYTKLKNENKHNL